MEKLNAELDKEQQKEFWLVERAEDFADRATQDFEFALEHAPDDKQIANSIARLQRSKVGCTKVIISFP